ncbi:YraN family protein [Corynebacterium sanguinis]|uniref:YraN family protein n=1 Tax=Corynebacterium sanguinis TaxID=2594913 RepID=UPI0011A25AA1|nr:YraN family protein [Corynebacterium sanguinis]MCT1555482.1 YraN family protein [Corynebacterium sanguinis]MCT1612970.1 YraN family protein [Corynebacterium sanguinis]MCT1663148.1 YraN family protein [Corynebacterium sanguinis]TVS25251.1 YraN family protein [Corynebacterium sanguinis]TVS27691.1 YraN family protein [Corynebacterium sanguinis]
MAQSNYAENHALALAGEKLAASTYSEMGYAIVGTRVRTKVGEIDLIVREETGTVVFVEVKTRRGRGFGAAEAVTAKKLRTMRRCAAEWLAGNAYAPVRFDVAEVIVTGETMDIRLFEDVDHGAC